MEFTQRLLLFAFFAAEEAAIITELNDNDIGTLTLLDVQQDQPPNRDPHFALEYNNETDILALHDNSHHVPEINHPLPLENNDAVDEFVDNLFDNFHPDKLRSIFKRSFKEMPSAMQIIKRQANNTLKETEESDGFVFQEPIFSTTQYRGMGGIFKSKIFGLGLKGRWFLNQDTMSLRLESKNAYAKFPTELIARFFYGTGYGNFFLQSVSLNGKQADYAIQYPEYRWRRQQENQLEGHRVPQYLRERHQFALMEEIENNHEIQTHDPMPEQVRASLAFMVVRILSIHMARLSRLSRPAALEYDSAECNICAVVYPSWNSFVQTPCACKKSLCLQCVRRVYERLWDQDWQLLHMYQLPCPYCRTSLRFGEFQTNNVHHRELLRTTCRAQYGNENIFFPLN